MVDLLPTGMSLKMGRTVGVVRRLGRQHNTFTQANCHSSTYTISVCAALTMLHTSGLNINSPTCKIHQKSSVRSFYKTHLCTHPEGGNRPQPHYITPWRPTSIDTEEGDALAGQSTIFSLSCCLYMQIRTSTHASTPASRHGTGYVMPSMDTV